ncbi:MAG: tetratricopeptide repeat protein [Leptolyngbyaceae cyanobacterium bins.302]|nr:tetratricopeptide repeat protein [Leptolyngbyaceae cyanobacterium bins.302]
MHPTLKLIGWTIAPLVLSLPIALVMGDRDGGATLAVSAKQHAQESISEKKAEGDRLLERGSQLYQAGQVEAAMQLWQQALTFYRAIKDQAGQGRALIFLGTAYGTLGNPTKAIEYYEQSLVSFRQSKNRKGEGQALLRLGVTYGSLNEHTKAIEYQQQSLAIFRELKNSSSEVYALLFLGTSYGALKNYPKAIEYHQQSLEISQKIKDRISEGAALSGLGLSHSSLDNYAKAIEYFKRHLEIAQETGDKSGERFSSISLGELFGYLDNPIEAIKYLEIALKLVMKSDNEKDIGLIFVSLGNSYVALGDYQKAIDYQEKGLKILSKIKNYQAEGNALNSLGVTYRNLGNYTESIKYHEKSLLIFRQFRNQESESTALGNLAISYRYLGRYSEALKYSYDSLLIAKEIKSKKLEAGILNGLGVVYKSLGNYIKAFDYHKKSLEITREIKNRHMQGNSLQNIAIIYDILGNPRKSIEYLEQQLEITRELKDRRGEANALGNLGTSHSGLGNYAKAISYQQLGLKIVREINNRQGERDLLGGLGTSYYLLGNYPKAIAYQQQGLMVARQIKDLAGEGNGLNNLGIALFLNNQPLFAEVELLKAVEIREKMYPELIDNQRRSLFEIHRKTYITLQKVQVALQKEKLALETSDRGRARAFIELLAARFAGETLENAIAKQKVEKLSIAQIQQVAKTQAATLVQYSIVSDKDLYIYIVQPDGSIHFRKTDLTTLGKSLNEFVNTSRDGLGVRGRTEEANVVVGLTPAKEQELRERRDRSLRQLHQLLIEPIADLLPKNENDRVIFMPQGELFLVPFPALLNAQNQPLITQYTILTAPSIQTLDLTHKTALSHPKGNRPALVVGNPTMPAVTTVIGDPPKKLSALPGSETEAKAIAAKLNTQPIIGDNAKKDAIVQKMQNAGIIHLATHGLLDSFKGDTPGAIALAPNGTNQTNDGLLTSGEIFDLKLNADLVVLSACDTGRGDITGDGVIGLSRSLFVAGVPSVIVSLWKVPDDSTALLMSEFYKNWKDRKLDKAQALRQAMLTTMKTNPNPRDWAAFTLIGEAE